MTFDKPQWLWRSAPAIEDYGYVRGAVYIYPERGRNAVAAVVVPSEFFQFLLGVLSEDDKKLASAKGVRFFLDDLGGGRWVFGFTYGAEDPYDLWIYTKSTLPVWFDRAKPVKGN